MSVYEDSRKVQALGSSLAVTLPAFFVELCGLEPGSEVRVIYGLDGVLVVVKDDNLLNLREGLLEIIEKLKGLESQFKNSRARRDSGKRTGSTQARIRPEI